MHRVATQCGMLPGAMAALCYRRRSAGTARSFRTVPVGIPCRGGITVPGGIPQGHPKGKSRRKPVFSEALDPNTPWTPKVPVHMSTPEYPEYPAQARLSSQGRAQLSRSIARSCATARM